MATFLKESSDPMSDFPQGKSEESPTPSNIGSTANVLDSICNNAVFSVCRLQRISGDFNGVRAACWSGVVSDHHPCEQP